VALLVVELDLDLAGLFRDPVELVDEVHVPRGAAELAVGGGLQPDLLLLPHDLADRIVLDAAKLRRVDAAGSEVVASLQELGGTQQAADVVGAERWLRPLAHARYPTCREISAAVRRSDSPRRATRSRMETIELCTARLIAATTSPPEPRTGAAIE